MRSTATEVHKRKAQAFYVSMKTDSNEATPTDVQEYKSIEYYNAW